MPLRVRVLSGCGSGLVLDACHCTLRFPARNMARDRYLLPRLGRDSNVAETASRRLAAAATGVPRPSVSHRILLSTAGVSIRRRSDVRHGICYLSSQPIDGSCGLGGTNRCIRISGSALLVPHCGGFRCTAHRRPCRPSVLGHCRRGRVACRSGWPMIASPDPSMRKGTPEGRSTADLSAHPRRCSRRHSGCARLDLAMVRGLW